MTHLLDYTLQLADNAVIMGQRLGEWCGHAPILEQDIALTNTSLDHIGRARNLYQFAAEQFNAMTAEEKAGCFSSVALYNKATQNAVVDEDDMAFLRDAWDYKNLLLVEQPNNDWAFTVARSFLYDTFNFYLFTALKSSNNATIAAIAEKSLKEVTYHMRWSSEWVIRLGDGTEESHILMQQSLNSLWSYTGEMFTPNAADKAMLEAGAGADLSRVKQQWDERVKAITEEATLTIPANSWMQQGGKDGRHTEHLGFMLADMQFMQRAYPDMEW